MKRLANAVCLKRLLVNIWNSYFKTVDKYLMTESNTMKRAETIGVYSQLKLYSVIVIYWNAIDDDIVDFDDLVLKSDHWHMKREAKVPILFHSEEELCDDRRKSSVKMTKRKYSASAERPAVKILCGSDEKKRTSWLAYRNERNVTSVRQYQRL